MTAGSYECRFLQQNPALLCVALRVDNSVLITLANCYPPKLHRAGTSVDHRLRDDDGRRQKDSTPVKIPVQTKVYVTTFNKTDAKNMKDKT